MKTIHNIPTNSASKNWLQIAVFLIGFVFLSGSTYAVEYWFPTSLTNTGGGSFCQSAGTATLASGYSWAECTGSGNGPDVDPTITYQWYADGVPITGATNSTYDAPLNISGSVTYYCEFSWTSANTNWTSTCTGSDAGPANTPNEIITVTENTTANAGGDQSPGDCSTSTTLAGNTITSGSGVWTVSPAGPTITSPTSPTSGVTGMTAGSEYTFTWTSVNGACSNSSDMIFNSAGAGCAVYFHPTVGLLGSYSGACPTVEDNGNYYDDGGVGSDYSLNINQIYRTFCPTTEGTCVNLNFTSFITESVYDYLKIQNGPAQNSPAMIQAPTNSVGELTGDLNASAPFSFQATNSSGCLTVRFESDASVVDVGWAAAITNVACTEAQPAGNSDCINSTPICDNTVFNDISNGPGLVTSEGCDACLTGESYSNWYTYTIASDGQLGLTITPLAAADYDFTLYKGTCGGAMERCSFSGVVGNTGLGNGAADVTEDAGGDSWVSKMNVVAGEVYYLMVNSWTANGPGFSLTWDLTLGSSLNCAVLLPVELSLFEAEYSPAAKGADLHWVTTTERDNHFFTIEKSRDGQDFKDLFVVDGAGNSTEVIDYFAFDPNVELGFTYYRLKQTDFNGDSEYTKIKTVNRLSDDIDRLTITPNPVQNSTDVFFNNYTSEFCTIKINDSYGNILYSEEFTSSIGGNTIRLDMSDYSKGIYFVEVVTNNKIYTDKIIKN